MTTERDTNKTANKNKAPKPPMPRLWLAIFAGSTLLLLAGPNHIVAVQGISLAGMGISFVGIYFKTKNDRVA